MQLLVFHNGKIILNLLNNVWKGVVLKYDEIQTRIYMSSAYYFYPIHIDHIFYENFCLEAKKKSLIRLSAFYSIWIVSQILQLFSIARLSWMRCYMAKRSEFSIRLQLEYKTSNVNIETLWVTNQNNEYSM